MDEERVTQIQIDADMERLIVETALQDYNASIDVRNKIDYGKDDKGKNITFDNRLQMLKDMWYGRRQVKTLPWKYCYSKDTEVLTKEGWKLIKDVRKGEYALSLNPKTQKSSYQRVIDTQQLFSEKLISFQNKAIDLLVTSDHRMLVKKSTKYSFVRADKLLKKNTYNRIPLTSIWNGKNVDKIYGFDSYDFMEFLGWYISEGFTYKSGTISICQSDTANKEKCLEIENLLKRMGLKYSYSDNKQFLISCKHSHRYVHKRHICNQIPKELREELKSLGKCHEKFIPRYYLNLSSDLLSILLEALTKGDGHKKIRSKKVPLWIYSTTSKLLADNIQELVQKIGLKATIHTKDYRGKAAINGITRRVIYIINIGFKKFIRTDRIEKKVIDYFDNVYDLTVEKYHTLFVRRNGKAVWSSNCSNRTMRIGMAILEMLHSRMFSAVWNEDLVRWKPGEKNDAEKVGRITKFMDWWVRVRVKMRPFFDGWVKTVTGLGNVTVEGSWDMRVRDTGKIKETPIFDEFGEQLYEQDGAPSVQRDKVFKVEEKTKTEIIPKENVFLQEGQKSLQDEPVIIKMKFFYSDLERMEREGKTVNISTSRYEESKSLREYLFPAVETVYANSTDENIAIVKEVKLQNTSVEVLKQYLRIDIDRDGFPEDIRVLIDPTNKIFLGGVLVRDLTKSGKRPLTSTKFNDYIDRVDELDGLGVLEIVKPLSDEIDAIFNQMTDANTLSVLRPGFYDPQGELRPSTIVIAPNKLIPVSDPQRNVFFPNFQIATERLLLAVRMVMEFLERLTGASSYIMGKESEIVGGSGTATRTQAIISNAEQRFSLPVQRLKDGAARVLTMVLDILQINIPPGLENRVLGEDNKPVFSDNELTQEGISGEFDAFILGDASMGSKQMEREITSLFYSMLIQNPLVASDPVKLYIATADVIKAYGKEPEKYLGPEPKLKDFDTPEDENTLISQGDFERVKAMITENHVQHMMTHDLLDQSPVLAAMAPELAQQVIAFKNAHKQEHMMMMQQMMNIGGQNGKARPGTAQGNIPVPGLENTGGPVGEVARRQGEGESQFSPTG